MLKFIQSVHSITYKTVAKGAECRGRDNRLYGGPHGAVVESATVNYRPQRSCEGYVFTPVCLSTGGSVAWSRGLLLLGGVPGPGGVCSGGVPGPRGYLLQGDACPRGCLLQGMPGLGGRWYPAFTEVDPPPQQTATVADGTHPTEIHSFCYFFYAHKLTRVAM